MTGEKILAVIMAPNVKQLVNNANELGVKKEDIVTILSMREGYMMIYYGEH